MRLSLLVAAAAASLIASGASAQTATFTGGASTPTAGFTVINEFTSLAGLTSVTNAQIKMPPSDSEGAPPATSDGSSYLSVLGGGSATYDLGAFNPRNIQFDWGSTDGYNSLTVKTAGGKSYVYVPGTNFPAGTDGNQVLPGTNGVFTLKLGDDRVSSVMFASGSNSFELDNFAIAGGVPEPTTWALMIVGFGAVGGAMRRRRAPSLATA
ncbi:PEPxxWA-CTERM sorting domain-containing protein [Sphingomonas sp.]|uniref:PEPxxWA-CTERM sorting domain-containing protein n=1 Tax=Sphingomonas sp. TaxID=28214 RepID=UPI003B00F0B2